MRRRHSRPPLATGIHRWIRALLCVSATALGIGMGPLLTLGPAAAREQEPAEVDRARAQIGRLLELRAVSRSVGQGEQERPCDRLRACAATIEAAGRRAGSAELRQALLLEATWGYFAASVPVRGDPPADPRRRWPARGWEDYLRLAWERIRAAPAAANRRELVRPLIPSVAFDGEVRRVGPVYGDAYWQPALELMRTADDPVIRVWAGAFAAERCMLADWELACALWRELLEIESSLPGDAASSQVCSPGSDRSLVGRALCELTRAFENELWRCSRDLQRALDLYSADGGGVSREDLPTSGAQFWRLLRPYLPEAIRQGPWNERCAAWMNLQSNRFLSTPGLRLEQVRDGGSAARPDRVLLILAIAPALR